MRPAGIGRSLVRFINLSRSTSITSLKLLAAPVTKNPPITSFIQLNHIVELYNEPHVLPPLAFTAIMKDIDAENTTKKVRRNFISFEKSANFMLYLRVNLPSGIN